VKDLVNTERVVCVHILPVIYQVTMCMFKGLAEHMLVVLASYVGKLNEMHFTAAKCSTLKNIITSLIFSVQKIHHVIDNNDTGLTMLKALLNNFTVCTECRKLMPSLPMDRQKLNEIRLLDRRSSLAKAGHIVNKTNSSNTTDLTNEEEVVVVEII
jgi:hypothetical protein